MPEQRWYKGNLHTHSLWSDGDEFPEAVVEWYRDHAYHFLALTDHNVLAQDGRWMSLADLQKKRRFSEAAVIRYLQRDGPTIQVRGQWKHDDFAVRLRPYGELVSIMERPGRFVLLPGEEITAFQPSVHVNAIGVPTQVEGRGQSKREALTATIGAVDELARESGRTGLAIINHPNFDWALTAEDLTFVPNGRFVEIFNGHPLVNQQGDPQHPSIERLWDLVNTARIGRQRLAPLLGLAGDDAHDFGAFGPRRANPGRGWIMVRCNELKATSLLTAIQAGEFYASTGVALRSVSYSPAKRMLELEIEPDGRASFTTRFIGSICGDPKRVGVTLACVSGLRAVYQMSGEELYVRAVVTSDDLCQSPGLENQQKQAWTQPVGWQMHLQPAGEPPR